MNSHGKIVGVIVGVSLVILVGAMIVMSSTSQKTDQISSTEEEVVAGNGIHWHPRVEIYVKGEKVTLESDIGRRGGEQPIHTHEEDNLEGVIHLEYPGIVTKDDIKLGKFFKIWGKEFNFGGDKIVMKVNGSENTEYDNYEMHDGDVIEIRYE